MRTSIGGWHSSEIGTQHLFHAEGRSARKFGCRNKNHAESAEDAVVPDMGLEKHAMRIAEAWEKTRWPELAPFFRQGNITHKRSSANLIIWGENGGVICCESDELANVLSAMIQRSRIPPIDAYLNRIYEALRAAFDIVELRTDLSLIRPVSPVHLDNTIAKEAHLVSTGTAGLPADLPGTVEHVYAITHGSRVVSWVTNIQVLNHSDYRLHSLRVETHPEYRREGYGKAVVAAMLNHLAAEDGAALWVCNADNAQSIAFAATMGFVSHLNVLRWTCRTKRVRSQE